MQATAHVGRVVPLRPDELYYVNQRKYRLGPEVPAWRRWFFAHVWMRFARFCYLRLRLPSPDGADRNGDVFWLEHERICFDEWQAEQEADKFEMPGIHRLPVTYSSPLGTDCVSLMPHSPANGRYKQNGKSKIEFPIADAMRLAEKLASNKSFTKNFKSPTSV